MRVRAIFEGNRLDHIVGLDDDARDLLADDALAELAVQDSNEALAAGGVTVDELRREECGEGEWTPLAALVLESARKLHT